LKIPDFELERWKAKRVIPGVTDLTETGIPEPLRLREFFSEDLLDLRMDYASIYGNDQLRSEISELYSGLDKENILVTSSTSESNMILTNLAVNNGDEVLIQVPSFMQIPGLVEANGVRIHKYYLEAENGFEFDIDKFNEAVTSKIKVFAFNYPNNPTGRVLDKSQVRAICEIAKDHNAWIIADEVYRGIEFDGPFSPSFAEFYDKALVSSSVSKVFGLAGLRVGWVVGSKDMIEKASAYKEYTTLGGSVLSEELAARVLHRDMRQKFIDRGRKLVRESFDVFDRWMRQNEGIVSYNKPKFGVIALVRHELEIPSNEFCRKLLEEKKIAVIPCDDCFPDLKNGDRYLRMCYCHPPAIVEEALANVSEVMGKYTGRKPIGVPRIKSAA
jgi:aspartate/methionine/tyrosine aminotransferase